jgi:dipeptidyl aminopeptidase/acylaminoacyl peptidase
MAAKYPEPWHRTHSAAVTRQVAPYGSWSSPIMAEAIAGGSVGLAQPELAARAIWWVESRPTEGGREVVVRAELDGGGRADAIHQGFSARTRVHEYGGGAFAVVDREVVFSNDADGRVYRGGEPLTPEPSKPRSLRYADFCPTPRGIACVRESHEGEGEPVNELVLIADAVMVVASGHDFYAAPRVSPDGRRLAWLSWDHPRMPWDGTELWVAAIDGSGAELVAGGPEESVVQPGWSPDGRLHWVSDRSGWWNLYREGEPLYPAEAEFGMPLWVFGQSMYVFLDDGRMACAWTQDGFPHLGLLDPEAGSMEELELPYLPTLRAARIRSDGRRVAYVGASPTRAPAVVVLDAQTGELTVIVRSTDDEPNPRYLTEPRPIEFESHGRTAHALYYPPRNDDFEAPNGERPPLVVMSHGGPTAQTEPALDLYTQFWTSRGVAVVDVNYGGSTGYGRPYRELLRGQWGVVDLEDCCEAALQLARDGEVDGKRLAITGGSAGGYTTLCALVFTDVFHVGASYYGVADIEPMFADTHKFESRYGDALVPPDKMRERSPIHFLDRISAPLIVFQGLDDPVVPPAQAELIVVALRERGIEHEYHAYEGETHGFRKAETIVDALNAELRFYGRVLGFDPRY